MCRDRFWRARLLALGAILVIAGCGDPPDDAAGPGLTGGWRTGGCLFVRIPETVTVGGVATPVTPPRLTAVLTRIEQRGRADFADSYAGVEVDQRRVRAIVYRVPSARFDDFIRRNAEDTCIVVRDAVHSAQSLATWHDRVVADLPYWTHQGVRIVSIGARHDGAGVEIGTRDVTRARRELPARYGREAPFVFVEEGPVRPLPGRSGPPTAAPRGG